MTHPPSASPLETLLARQDIPVVSMDDQGILTALNSAFTRLYGWSTGIVGQPLTVIMPPHMRQAHTIGFSRMITTEQPKLLGKPVKLPVLHEKGHVVMSELVILGEKVHGTWAFASSFTPLDVTNDA